MGALTLPRTQLANALDYAAHGWAVLPLWWPVDGRCACGKDNCNPAKHPVGIACPNGVHDATTDPATIREWWTRWPRANIGIATGERSGLLVLDVDTRNGGHDRIKSLIAELGPLPDAPRVATGGGGWHVYLRHTGPAPKEWGRGVDVLTDGRIATAPPSLHISGRRYRWEVRPW